MTDLRRSQPASTLVTGALAAAITLVVAVTAVGCSPTRSDDDRSGATPPATTIDLPAGTPDGGPTDRPTNGPPVTGSTIPGPAPDIDERDVADPAVGGLGDPRIDVHRYEVTLRADPGQDEISGRAQITLAPRTAEPLPAFTLDLRGPTVDTATVDGVDAEVRASGDQIEITPATPLDPGETTEVDITYAGHPRPGSLMGLAIDTGLQHDDEGGWFAMSQPDGTRTWMPTNDHPSDKALWQITLDTPTDVVGVSNGRLQSNDRDGDRRHWVWEVDRPMASYLALVAIGDYELVESDGPDGIRITSAFPHSLGAEERATFDDIGDIVSELADAYGAYPDDDLGVVVVPQALGVALETQTRPLFGTDTIGLRDVVVHELAHQWGGDSVTPATWDHLWLSEGFATFASDDVSPPLGGTSVPVASPEAALSLGNTLYHGGAVALLALRDEIGEERFDQVLREWFDRYGGGTATTEDFVDLAGEVSETDLSDWATTWLYEPQPPYAD